MMTGAAVLAEKALSPSRCHACLDLVFDAPDSSWAFVALIFSFIDKTGLLPKWKRTKKNVRQAAKAALGLVFIP